jgi:hypothetical protein
VIEQRRARRFPIRVQLHITGEPDLEISADTQDISASGLLLSTDQQVADGSMLRFVMTFPASVTKGKPLRVRCTGQVVRVDKKPSDYEVAVRFKHFQFLSPTFDH